MVRARLRPDLAGHCIPAHTHPSSDSLCLDNLFQLDLQGEVDAEQPDLCEDQEFNTLINYKGSLLWVQSIDLEFL